MKNGVLITIWVDVDKEDEFLKEIEWAEAPMRKIGHTTAETVIYQMSCFAVNASSVSIDISYDKYGFMDQVGFTIDLITSYQVS